IPFLRACVIKSSRGWFCIGSEYISVPRKSRGREYTLFYGFKRHLLFLLRLRRRVHRVPLLPQSNGGRFHDRGQACGGVPTCGDHERRILRWRDAPGVPRVHLPVRALCDLALHRFWIRISYASAFLRCHQSKSRCDARLLHAGVFLSPHWQTERSDVFRCSCHRVLPLTRREPDRKRKGALFHLSYFLCLLRRDRRSHYSPLPVPRGIQSRRSHGRVSVPHHDSDERFRGSLPPADFSDSTLLPFGFKQLGMVLLYAVSLSSSDTIAFVISSIFTRDLQNYVPRFGEKSMRMLTRIFMVVFIGLAILVSLISQDILTLGFALAGIAIALSPAILRSFFFRLNDRAVAISLALSMLSIVVLFLFDLLSPETALISLPVALVSLVGLQVFFARKLPLRA